MKYYLLVFLAFIFVSCQQKSNSIETPAPQVSKHNVFFKNINNGDTLVSPFSVEMGVVGMKIKPAGELEAGSGHHHIIVDKDFMKYGEIIPMDANHLHYGKGDTIVTLNLEKGQHTLTLQFANGMHMSYGKQFSNEVNIYVK